MSNQMLCCFIASPGQNNKTVVNLKMKQIDTVDELKHYQHLRRSSVLLLLHIRCVLKPNNSVIFIIYHLLKMKLSARTCCIIKTVAKVPLNKSDTPWVEMHLTPITGGCVTVCGVSATVEELTDCWWIIHRIRGILTTNVDANVPNCQSSICCLKLCSLICSLQPWTTQKSVQVLQTHHRAIATTVSVCTLNTQFIFFLFYFFLYWNPSLRSKWMYRYSNGATVADASLQYISSQTHNTARVGHQKAARRTTGIKGVVWPSQRLVCVPHSKRRHSVFVFKCLSSFVCTWWWWWLCGSDWL